MIAVRTAPRTDLRAKVEALRDGVARELFDDIPNDEHGQLCPIWTKRPERRRKNAKPPAWTDCDCWQLRRVRHLADLALSAIKEASDE